MLKTIHSLSFISVFSKHCESKTTWIKSKHNMVFLDLVKLDEPNMNRMQEQEKASKLWNDVKGSPSDYLELIVELERGISLKKLRRAAVWKSLVKKTQKTTINKSDGKIKTEF